MIVLPLIKTAILSRSEAEDVADYIVGMEVALEEATKANMTLLTDFYAQEAKIREYSEALVESGKVHDLLQSHATTYENLLLQQSEAARQIMQINNIMAEAMGEIREVCDADREAVDEIVDRMTSRLAEFGGDGA